MLAKAQNDLNDMRSLSQAESSKAAETASRRIAELQSMLDAAHNDHASAQQKAAALLTSQERRSDRAAQASQEALSQQQRLLREKTEQCERLSSRALQLEQQLTLSMADQQDLEQQCSVFADQLDSAERDRDDAEQRASKSASRVARLLEFEEQHLREASSPR